MSVTVVILCKSSARSTFSEVVKLLTELVVLTTALVELIRLFN